jgi:hypothetical protein
MRQPRRRRDSSSERDRDRRPDTRASEGSSLEQVQGLGMAGDGGAGAGLSGSRGRSRRGSGSSKGRDKRDRDRRRSGGSNSDFEDQVAIRLGEDGPVFVGPGGGEREAEAGGLAGGVGVVRDWDIVGEASRDGRHSEDRLSSRQGGERRTMQPPAARPNARGLTPVDLPAERKQPKMTSPASLLAGPDLLALPDEAKERKGPGVRLKHIGSSSAQKLGACPTSPP